MAAPSNKTKLAKKILKELAVDPDNGFDVLERLHELLKTKYQSRLPTNNQEYDELYKALEAKHTEETVPVPKEEVPLPTPTVPSSSSQQLPDTELFTRINVIIDSRAPVFMKKHFITKLLRENNYTDSEINELMADTIPTKTTPAASSSSKRREPVKNPEESEDEEATTSSESESRKPQKSPKSQEPQEPEPKKQRVSFSSNSPPGLENIDKLLGQIENSTE